MPYPLNLKDRVVNNDLELFELIDEAYTQMKTLEDRKLVDRIELRHVLDNIGLENTAQLSDKRTLQILKEYEFYKCAPHLGFDNLPWFESVVLLNEIQLRLF